jgi:LysM repeat protein
MSRTRKIFNYLSILIILAALLGFSAQPASAATCTKYHTVQRGEYLVSIGRIYGVHWRTLAQINNLANPSLIFPGQRLCVATDGTPLPPAPPSRIPTFSIVEVDEGEDVTIRTANFPANDTFRVRMGKIGTQGIGGKVVDTINSGQGGTFTANFRIPGDLRNDARIAIRLESTTGSGYFAYNWFYNDTTGTGGQPPSTPVYRGIPTFNITAVVRNQTVTILTNNFPANQDFVVRMDVRGNRALGGIVVTTFNSGSGGAFSKTFDIPAALQGVPQIAVRTDSTTTPYHSYNWFYNNSTQ